MIAASKAAGTMLSIFHNRRHDGDFLALKEAIDKGMIGEVYHIEAGFSGYGKPGTWWRSNKEISGGNFYDWGAHFIDWILNLVPQPVTGVTGHYIRKVWLETTNEDHTQAYIHFANGCIANLVMSNIDRSSRPRWRISGTTGAIVDTGNNAFTLHTAVDGFPATVTIPYKKTDWQVYYNGIAAHLLQGAELDVKPEEGRRIISILEAAERSSAAGCTEVPAYP